MDSLARSLRAFRDSFYRCLDRRADALFELTDATLTAGSVPSPVHLRLATVHRRGWGSLYVALRMGRMDEGGLRGLLSRHTLADRDPGAPTIYALNHLQRPGRNPIPPPDEHFESTPHPACEAGRPAESRRMGFTLPRGGVLGCPAEETSCPRCVARRSAQ
jgi:hypothetical protein